MNLVVDRSKCIFSWLLFQYPIKKQQNIKLFQFSLSPKLNNVTITATIPSSGYAPGQVIPLELMINNKSNRDISNFRIVLNKVSVYNKNNKKKFADVQNMIDGDFHVFFFFFFQRFLIILIRPESRVNSISYFCLNYSLMDVRQMHAINIFHKLSYHQCRQLISSQVKFYTSHTN